MFKVYMRAIKIALVHALWDIKGILFSPRATLQEIAERKTWGAGAILLPLAVCVGFPQLNFLSVEVIFDESDSGSALSFYAAFVGLFCGLLSLSLYLWRPIIRCQWRQLFQLLGYAVVPQLVLGFLAIPFIILVTHYSGPGRYEVSPMLSLVTLGTAWRGDISAPSVSPMLLIVVLGIILFMATIYTLTVRLLVLILRTVCPSISTIRALGCVVVTIAIVGLVLSPLPFPKLNDEGATEIQLGEHFSSIYYWSQQAKPK